MLPSNLLSVGSTKVVDFRKNKENNISFQFMLGNQKVKNVPFYKYLGVYLDENLTYEYHVEMLAKSGTRALGAVIPKNKHLSTMGYTTFTKCFESYVCAVLDYSSDVWGFVTGQKIDAVQNEAMRVFFRGLQVCSQSNVIWRQGVVPIKATETNINAQFFYRLLKMNITKLPKLIFEREYQLNGKWCQAKRNMLK